MAAPVTAAQLDHVNRVNIWLMLASAALACMLPFEVFLASYAILGPLHYLTQISWLRDRGWFTTGRWDWIPLALMGFFALDAVYMRWIGWDGGPFVALMVGIVAAFVRQPAAKLATLAGAVALAIRMDHWEPGLALFVVLLPTVIHVFVFTGLFILAGSIKSRSRTGYVSFGVFVACGLTLLFAQPPSTYQPSPYTLANLGQFKNLLHVLTNLLPGAGSRDALTAIGRFLAFAYTYHYLNWFSKTGVIRWHEITRTRMASIGALWLASIALYAYDYAVGLAALFLLSIVHVFLEFPLDARTLVGIVNRAPAAADAPATPGLRPTTVPSPARGGGRMEDSRRGRQEKGRPI